jgi:hypothetical protein
LGRSSVKGADSIGASVRDNDTLSTEVAVEDYEVCIKQLTKTRVVVEAATGLAEASEAPVEEKAGEVVGEVKSETPATLVDEAAPAEIEEEEVTAPLVEVEAAPVPNAEVVGSNGVSRLERLNSACFSSEGAGVASLDCRRGDDQVSGSVSAQNGHGIDATAPPTESGLDDVEYYVPEIGHRVLGIVVSGSRTKFYVDVGAAKLGELKASQLFPLDWFQVK